MMKSYTLMILNLPIIMNCMMIIFLMMPSKIYKFNPLYLMLILIFLTFIISLKINFILKSWIPYILFLMMIGGLMIIFLYINSISNNKMFLMNLKKMISNYMKITCMMMIMYWIIIYLNDLSYFNIYFIKNNNFQNLMNLNINLFYQKFFNMSTIFMMLYLYYTMIIIMNICLNNKKPLRQIKL